ncbi:hypothetical protein AGJ19_07140 [Cronobacter sakazakii]|nr:hypothetical protein [Cronobacter sakazakii]EJG0827868.1 hypothetical protein [Cronobacter sakazakii]
MKLIDLLVQELPKRGGWPDGANFIAADSDGDIDSYNNIPVIDDSGLSYRDSKGEGYFLKIINSNKGFRAIDWETAIITREQYEAALAAAQQPVWDGEGLPPVGCECEAKYRDATNAEWFFFRCVGVDCGVAFGWAGKDAVTLDKGRYEFRPFRSEADNKRAIGVTALAKAGGNVDFEYGRKTIDGELSSPGWYELYDKIAAGEVAGIRIE